MLPYSGFLPLQYPLALAVCSRNASLLKVNWRTEQVLWEHQCASCLLRVCVCVCVYVAYVCVFICVRLCVMCGVTDLRSFPSYVLGVHSHLTAADRLGARVLAVRHDPTSFLSLLPEDILRVRQATSRPFGAIYERIALHLHALTRIANSPPQQCALRAYGKQDFDCLADGSNSPVFVRTGHGVYHITTG